MLEAVDYQAFINAAIIMQFYTTLAQVLNTSAIDYGDRDHLG